MNATAAAAAEQDRAHQEPGQAGLVLRDLRVHGGQRKIGVDHPQHPLAGAVHVASGVRAFRRVLDGADDRHQVVARAVREKARAVRPVQLGQRLRLRVAPVARLGALIHRRADLRARRWNT